MLKKESYGDGAVGYFGQCYTQVNTYSVIELKNEKDLTDYLFTYLLLNMKCFLNLCVILVQGPY